MMMMLENCDKMGEWQDSNPLSSLSITSIITQTLRKTVLSNIFVPEVKSFAGSRDTAGLKQLTCLLCRESETLSFPLMLHVCVTDVVNHNNTPNNI